MKIMHELLVGTYEQKILDESDINNDNYWEEILMLKRKRHFLTEIIKIALELEREKKE